MTPEPGRAPDWDEAVEWWLDGFTSGADVEYELQILPLLVELVTPRPGSRVLDLGTGEGQGGRSLAAAGADVVGVDLSAPLLAAARRRSGFPLVRADIAAPLPFRDATFDAACCVLVLEHVADITGVFAEVARVLRPRGVFVLMLNHPLLSAPGSNWVDDTVFGEQYWQLGPYLDEVGHDEQVESGRIVRFHHRPLGIYLEALIAAGFRLTAFREPAPVAEMGERAFEYDAQRAFPRLLAMAARSG